MKRFMFSLIPSLLLAAPAFAQMSDLSGEWEARFTVAGGMIVEDVAIQQTANAIQAIKLTGDSFVPAGTINLRGRLGAGAFPAQQRCYSSVSKALVWTDVRVTILDNNHFRVEGGCSGGAIWKRMTSGSTS